MVPDDLAGPAKSAGRPEPRTDGRLCAMAETLLGWPEPGTPPQAVVAFLSQYFGLTSPAPQVVVANLETEDSRVVADKVVENVKPYLQHFGQIRYGMTSERIRKNQTRLVVVLFDEAVTLDPFPRRLDPKQSATLAGSLAGDLESPRVLFSDALGQLSEPAQAPGQALRAVLACGEKPARLYVEIRANQAGKPKVVASFPVACGLEPPASVTVPTKDSWPAEASKQERKVLDNVNAERTTAGLPPLTWDDGLAEVARGLADALGEQARKGSTGSPDIRERLEKAGIATPLVLVNPAQGRSGEEAQRQLLGSPAHRANFMNPEVTNAGVGLSVATLQDGQTATFLAEIFVKVLPPMDVAEVRKSLAAAIAKRRSDEHKSELALDPALEEVAENYASEMAAAKGALPPDRDEQVLASLKKGFASVNMLIGASISPLEYANEHKALASGDRLGVGVAQGDHPKLGKNTAYVVVLIGTSRGPDKKAGAKK
jgi:uncharacterized protein YkwD